MSESIGSEGTPRKRVTSRKKAASSEGKAALADIASANGASNAAPTAAATETQLPRSNEPRFADREVELAQTAVTESVAASSVPYELICARAYELFVERGSSPGHELEDWLQAERELKQAWAVGAWRQSEDALPTS